MKNIIHKPIFLIITALIWGMVCIAVAIAQNSSDAKHVTTIHKPTNSSEALETKNSIKQSSIKKDETNPDIIPSKRKEDYWDRIAPFVNTFFTAILALLTCIYVILTYRILKEMREARNLPLKLILR